MTRTKGMRGARTSSGKLKFITLWILIIDIRLCISDRKAHATAIYVSHDKC